MGTRNFRNATIDVEFLAIHRRSVSTAKDPRGCIEGANGKIRTVIRTASQYEVPSYGHAILPVEADPEYTP